MANEEAIKQELIKKFDFLTDKITVQRERRIFVAPLESEQFYQVFDYVARQMNFTALCTITGVDEGEVFVVIYHFSRDDGTMLNLKLSAPREKPIIKTITDYFPGAVFYERELVDLLGLKVEGLPEGKRYPLPDDWPEGQYPLRKDWKPEMLKQ